MASRTIFVAANQREPYICRYEFGPWYCVFITALELICKLKNFRCIIRDVPRKGLKNEHLDGVLGALTNRTADIGIAALGMTYNRAKYHYYVPSLFNREYSVLISKNKLENTYGSSGAVISPLRVATWDVWCGIIVMLLFISGCVALLKKRPSLRNLMHIAFLLFGSTLNQDDIRPPLGTFSRSLHLFVLLWLGWSFVLITMFSSTMSSIFTVVPNKALPFTDFESFLTSGFHLETTTQAQQLLIDSKSPLEQSVGRTVTVTDDKKQWVTNIQRIQNREEKFATMVGNDVFSEIGNYSRHLIEGRCRPQVIAMTPIKLPIASLVLPYGSKNIEIFQKQLRIFLVFYFGSHIKLFYRLWETGVIPIMFKKGLRTNGRIGRPEPICGPDTYIPVRLLSYGNVSLERVRFIWFGLILGEAFAICIFVSEYFLAFLRFARGIPR